jgi:RNA polymerase sigma-70 factor (ECF subfamily)
MTGANDSAVIDHGEGGEGGQADDERASVFESHRSRLFAIAYRMLGSIEDAEDVVQETFLRWRSVDTAQIRTPGAWLSTVVTRLSLNQLQLSRTRRGDYIGPWLPEPLPTATSVSPADDLERADSISIAFLVVMERLNPRERATFLLREVFDYDYEEIAGILDLSVANCRQLFHRAKARMGESVARFRPDPARHRELIEQFGRAVRLGDIDEVVQLLARDATLNVDSGGEARAAARRPLSGALPVAQFLTGVIRKMAPVGMLVHVIDINGEPALVSSVDGVPQQVVTISIGDARIQSINIIANPAKLKRVADTLAMLADAGELREVWRRDS